MNTESTTEAVSPIRAPQTSLTKTFSFFSRVSPQLTSKVAAQLFVLPQRYKLSKDEQDMLNEGTPLHIHVGARQIAGWRWGRGPSVLLVHGWSGCAAQFTPLIRSLIERNYSVIAFDLPAHGQSAGKQTNLYECMNTVEAIANRYEPFHGVLGHSFGGLAAALVLNETRNTNRLVLVSPLTGANYALHTFGSMIGVNTDVQTRVREYFENKLGIAFAECDFSVLADRLAIPTLVVHDRGDRMILWNETAKWVEDCDQAQLLTTEGLGHQRILADTRVAERIKGFLGEGKVDIRSSLLSEYAL